MEMYQDGVPVMILPETAKCELAGISPLDVRECPIGKGYCCGDCEFYEEVIDELYRLLSDCVSGCYPLRTEKQKERYKEAVKIAAENLARKEPRNGQV